MRDGKGGLGSQRSVCLGMRWNWLRRRRVLDAGERARMVHEQWLTWAMHKPAEVPRIPTRRVKPDGSGGYDRLRQREGGPSLAKAWWDEALEWPDLDPNSGC